MIEGRKVLDAIRKIKELAEATRNYDKLEREVRRLLGKEVELEEVPQVDKVELECGNVYVDVERGELKLIEGGKVAVEFNGYRIKRRNKGGYIGWGISLEKPTIGDLIVLAAMEERCKVLTRLIETVKGMGERAEESLEKLRKLVALVEMATKS